MSLLLIFDLDLFTNRHVAAAAAADDDDDVRMILNTEHQKKITNGNLV